MTYPTHRQYAISFSFITAMLIYKLSMSQVNYYLALGIIILTAKYGALFPDIDHNWANVKEKTVPNWIINKLIHKTGGKHRSWQTHSIDILVVSSVIVLSLPSILYNKQYITEVNKEIATIILVGFFSGWVSHLIADMMTSAGVRLFCWNKKLIIKLVPKSIGKLKFNTGNEWEDFVFKTVKLINIGLGFACLLYPIIIDGTLIKMIESINGG